MQKLVLKHRKGKTTMQKLDIKNKIGNNLTEQNRTEQNRTEHSNYVYLVFKFLNIPPLDCLANARSRGGITFKYNT